MRNKNPLQVAQHRSTLIAVEHAWFPGLGLHLQHGRVSARLLRQSQDVAKEFRRAHQPSHIVSISNGKAGGVDYRTAVLAFLQTQMPELRVVSLTCPGVRITKPSAECAQWRRQIAGDYQAEAMEVLANASLIERIHWINTSAAVARPDPSAVSACASLIADPEFDHVVECLQQILRMSSRVLVLSEWFVSRALQAAVALDVATANSSVRRSLLRKAS